MSAFARTLLLLLAVVAMSSCSDMMTDAGSVEVRFRNATSMELSDVSLAWPGGSMAVAQLPFRSSRTGCHVTAVPVIARLQK
ncbi:MAG: hypothetical protein ABI664_14435 [bacterium]